MKKLVSILAGLAAILAFTACGNSNDEKQFNSFQVQDLPPLTVGDSLQGVAAPFAGMDGEWLIVAGGCNFPDTSAARGGEKRFYADVFALNIHQPTGRHGSLPLQQTITTHHPSPTTQPPTPTDGQTRGAAPTANHHHPSPNTHGWVRVGQLPRPLAYGASVVTPEGILCIGGTTDGKSSSADVFLLRDGGSRCEPLPSLPKGLDQMAAASAGGVVYVAGGQTDGELNTMVYAYDMASRQWSTFATADEVPSWSGCLQPCLAVQNGSNGPELLLFGGFSPVEKVSLSEGIAWNLKTKAVRTISPLQTSPEGGNPPLPSRREGALISLAHNVGAKAMVEKGSEGLRKVQKGSEGFRKVERTTAHNVGADPRVCPNTSRGNVGTHPAGAQTQSSGQTRGSAPTANHHHPTPTTHHPTPIALVGATAMPCGANNVLFFGGVDKQTFDAALQHPQPDYLLHPAEWYHFRDSLLVYNTITGAWSTVFADKRLARAGAAVVKGNAADTYYIVNGELKPGVRSADVTSLTIAYTAQFGWLNYLVLVVYLVAMLLLGYYFMRRESGSDDFFKGGNRIPWWAAGISIFATMLSAITYMSIPAKAYMTDWTYYPMQVCILIVSFPVIRYFLPFFRRLNVTTAYEYLEHRFSYAIRLMASVLFIVFMVARMALVLFLPSLAMTAVTGIDIYVCIVVMAVVTIIYCTMGGVEAVVWGDVVQGIILVGGAFLAAAYLIGNTGSGPADFFQIACADDKFRLFDWSFDYRTATFWVVILGGLANNIISYTSDQTVIQRYLTTKDEPSAARSILTNGMMSVVVTIAFFTIGTGLYTFYQTHPTATDLTMQKTDAIFPFFMMSQLPAGVAGLLIAAVFAATMSTISSNINSISTAFTVDIWKKLRPQLSDKATVRTARLTGIVSGVVGMLIAILMATTDIQSLLDYFNTILGLLSGAVGALFIMGIFFPRIGARAAFVGFVAGTLTVFWMNFCTTANFLLFGFTAITVSTLVALLLSLVWPERRPLKGFTWKTLNRE